MDFHSMKRKDLQALCKKHNLFANGTNVEIADRLASHLKKKPVVVEEEKKSKSKKDELIQELGQTRVTRSKRGGEDVVDPVPNKKLKVVDEKSEGNQNQDLSVRVTRRGAKAVPKVSAKRRSSVADLAENVGKDEEVGGGRVTRRGVKDLNKEEGLKEEVSGRVTRRGVKEISKEGDSKGNAGSGVGTSRSLRNREVVQSGAGSNVAKEASSPRKEKTDGNNEVAKVGTRQTRARKNENKEVEVEVETVLPVVNVAVAENETQQATRRQTRKSVVPTIMLPEKSLRPSRRNVTTNELKMGTVDSGKSDGQNGDKAGKVSATETNTRQTRARKKGSNESDAPVGGGNDTIAETETETQVATRSSKRKPVASSSLVVKSRKLSSSSDVVVDVASERNENKELGVQKTSRAMKKLTKAVSKKASSVSKLVETVVSTSKGNEETGVQTTRALRNKDVLPSGVNPTKKASSPRETARALKVVQNNDREVENSVLTSPRQTRDTGGNKEGGEEGNVVFAENATKKTIRRTKHSSVAPTNLSAEKSSRSKKQGPTADAQKKGTVESRNSDTGNEVGVENIAVSETRTRQTRAKIRGIEDVDFLKKDSGVETGTQQSSRSSKRKSVPQTSLMVENLTQSSSVELVDNVESDNNGNEDTMVKESTELGGENGSSASVLEKNASSIPLAVENIGLTETGTPQATRSSKRKSPAVSVTSTRQTRSRKRGNDGGYTPLPVEITNFSKNESVRATKYSKRKSTAPTDLVAEMQSEEENAIGADNIDQQGTHSKCQLVTPTSAAKETSSRQSKECLSEVSKVSDDPHAETADGTSLEGNLKSSDECAQLKLNAGGEPEGVVLTNNDDAASLFKMIHDKEKIEPIQSHGGASSLNVVNAGLEDVGGITEDAAVSEKMGSLPEETSDQVKEKHVDRAEELMESAPSNASLDDSVLDREISQQANRISIYNSSDGSSVFDLEDVAKLPMENRQDIFVGSALEDRHEDFEGNLEQLNLNDLSEDIRRKEDMCHLENEDRVLITSPCSQDKRQEINLESIVPDRQTEFESNLEQLNPNDPSDDVTTKEGNDGEDRMLNASDPSDDVITKEDNDERRQETIVVNTVEEGQDDYEVNLEQLSASDPLDDIITKEDTEEKSPEIIVESTVQDGQEDSEDNLQKLNASDPSDDIITEEDTEGEDRMLTSFSEEKSQEIIVKSTVEDEQEDPEGNLDQLNAGNPSDDIIAKEDTEETEKSQELNVESAVEHGQEDVAELQSEKSQEIIVKSTVEDEQEDPEGNLIQLNAGNPLDDIIAKEDTEETEKCQELNVESAVEHGQEDPEYNVGQLNVTDLSADIIAKEDTEGEDRMLTTSSCSQDFVVVDDGKDKSLQEVCDSGKMIKGGSATSVKHLGHDSVEKREIGCAPIVATVEHGDSGRGVDLVEEYSDINDQHGKLFFREPCMEQITTSVSEKSADYSADRMDHLEHVSGSEEEWTFPGITVDQKEDIGNEEGTVSTLPHNLEEVGYQENTMMQNIMNRKEDFGNAEGTVSTLPQDTGCHETHVIPNVEDTDDCCVSELPARIVNDDVTSSQDTGCQETHVIHNVSDADDCCVSEMPGRIVNDDVTTAEMDKGNLDLGSEEESMLSDRTVDREDYVEEDITNAEVSPPQDTGCQETDTTDANDCCVSEKPAKVVDDDDNFVIDKVNPILGSEAESMFTDRTVDLKENADATNAEENHMVQNTEDTDEFCVSDLGIKEACEVQKENVSLYNQCRAVEISGEAPSQTVMGSDGNLDEVISQTAMGFEDEFDSPVASDGNKDDLKPISRTVGYDDFSASGNLLNQVGDTSGPVFPLNNQQGDDPLYQNLTLGGLFDKQETGEILQEVRVLETEEFVTETELVENLATDEETEAIESPDSETFALCASPEDEYLGCPPVLISKDHFKANEDVATDLRSEHMDTDSTGDEENTSSFSEKPRGIVAHHGGDSTHLSLANLHHSLEEQMVAEEVVDQKEGLFNLEGMALKDLGDGENHLVHQAEDASDCNVEGSVVGRLGSEKHMTQKEEASACPFSDLDYSPSEPCEDKENSYATLGNLVDYPEAAVGSSLCSSDVPRENVIDPRGDMESKYDNFDYEIGDWLFDDVGTKDAVIVQGSGQGHEDQTSACVHHTSESCP